MLLIVSCYTANLAASLTSKKLDTPINSAEDLIKSDIKFGTWKSSSTLSLLRKSKMKVLNNLAHAINSHGENVDFGQGLDKVLSEDYALITEDGTLNRDAGDQHCLHYQVGEPLIKVYQGIGLQKCKKLLLVLNYVIILFILDSPYTDRINKALLGFLNDGTLNLLEEKWMRKNDCSNDKVNSLKNGQYHLLIIR